MSEQDNGAEAIISDETQLDTLREGIDDPQVLREQLTKEAEARRQLTARARAAEAELKELKGKKQDTVTTESTISSSSADTDSKIWEIADLIRQGYTKKDAEFLQSNGGKAALSDPNSYASVALKGIMEQRKAESAASQTDQSGGEDTLRAFNFNLPKNPSLADLKKSTADMEKALPHAE